MIALATALSLFFQSPVLANDTLASSDALIECVAEEETVASCAEPFICQPDGAFFGRLACADRAAMSVASAVDHYRSELAFVLADLEAREPQGGYVAAEEEAHAAWLAYRDANCRGDRTTALDALGVDELRQYCHVEHGIQRLAVIRDDLDRFRFKLAAVE